MQEKRKLFEILNEFFDKIYVINLQRSVERRKLIRARFEGLNFEFHRAVDAKDLDMSQIQEKGLYHSQICKILKKRRGVPVADMPIERIACALSHRSLIEKAKNEQLKRVLIFEDDVILQNFMIEALKKGLSDLPDNWDLLYMGHWSSNSNPSNFLKFQATILKHFSKVTTRFERLRVLTPDVIEGWFPIEHSQYLDLSGNQFGTYAYALSASGMDKLSGFLTPIVQEVDNMLGELCNYKWLNAYNIRPVIFSSDDSLPSTIDISR